MNPSHNFEFFRHVAKKTQTHIARDLLTSLENRAYANKPRKDGSIRASCEIFAEDEFVRKEGYDEMRCEMPGQPRSTFLMVFSPDGTTVASTHGNHNIYVTDLKSGKNVRTLTGHPRTPWCIAFHPTSNQIVASGCLGGEVRIWDLSGGSEVWTAGNQSVIASIAFHPNDRILVIATYNELYFWDWSRPEPFMQVATSNPKEKIRYVAFDKLGQKLITGIANSPQTRWERVRAPVPVQQRQNERSVSPYRLRITPRLVNSVVPPDSSEYVNPNEAGTSQQTAPRTSMSSVPDRERRITASYRNLLREYELLVQRYLKVYKPPTMIDRGTDPMEPTNTSSSTQAPEGNSSLFAPSATQTQTLSNDTIEPQPSTSRTCVDSLVMPSRILAMKQQPTTSGTQTNETLRKHKSNESESSESPLEKRTKCDTNKEPTEGGSGGSSSKIEAETQTHNIKQKATDKLASTSLPSTREEEPQPSTSRGTTEDLLSNIRPIAEEVRNRLLPIIKSLPVCDRPKLIRRFENSRVHERLKFRQACPTILKKPNRRPIQSTDGSSSDDDDQPSETNAPRQPHTSMSESVLETSNTNRVTGVKNFIMELEQLLMSIITTEIETNETTNNTTNQEREPETTMNSSSPMSPSIPSNRGDSIFRRIIQHQEVLVQARANLVQQLESRNPASSDERSRPGPSSTSARTSAAGSTPNRAYPRRRLSSHRISAFLPTLVNYNRNAMRYRRRNTRFNLTFMNRSADSLDEPINYSQRPNAEDLPNELNLSDSSTNVGITSPINRSLDSMYSNIVQDLETSLNDVRNIRASNRPGETSDMLSSFSESLENIMNQSDTILRSLGVSLNSLPGPSADSASASTSAAQNEPYASFANPNFFVRNRNESVLNLSLNHRAEDERNVIETDHNYPRQEDGTTGVGASQSPLMTSLHLTISYIQRQARQLRQQVESIERIDRAMFEVEQLQLIRQLILEFLRYIRSLSSDSRSTGLSSVRQMMAGTRISDSTSADEPQPSTSSATDSSAPPPTHEPRPPRQSGRKTYPPSRLHRQQRHSRRSVFVNFFPRRYGLQRGGAASGRGLNRAHEPPMNPLRNLASMALINTNSLSLMAARLEHLLTDHTRIITRPQEAGGPASTSGGRSGGATSLEERMLSFRLHDCSMRMNRILTNRFNDEPRFRRVNHNERMIVTADGTIRFPARHFLCLVIDRMSKHVEDLGAGTLSQNIRAQIHNVLAMALLLSDLLLLQLVDSIPPPAGMNLDVERESLTSRINQMCGQMLQNRFSGHSHQLTQNLHQMRLTMRHAHRALGQTYTARRNAMMPNRSDTSRRQLLSIYLRNLNWRRELSDVGGGGSASTARSEPRSAEAGWNGLRDLIMRYSDNTAGEDDDSQASTRDGTASSRPLDSLTASPSWSNSNNNSDDNDDESESYGSSNNNGAANRTSTNLYRTNNVNLAHSGGDEARPWYVPSVQVNDVPIADSDTETLDQLLARRQRVIERMSALRNFSHMSVLRPRFLHPLYASFNPFDAEMDDTQRETNYDFDMVTTVTPNHRIQMWDISAGNIPAIDNPLKNLIVSECKIHNDASVDIAKDGTLLVTLLPSGGYMNVTNKLGVYSLKWDSMGQCLYTTSFDQNAVSVSLSPLSRHLVVGLASRRVTIVPSDRWTMAQIFLIDPRNVRGDRLPVLRELGQTRDGRATNYKSVNCIRWLPTSGQGLVYATNTGQLVILT